jgi:hypothetical protein
MIDRRLRHEREVISHLRRKGFSKPKSLLYQKIPVRLNDWDTSVIENLGIDFVEHCGSSKMGHYVNSLSVTEVGSGWWEGQAIMGRGQEPTLKALKKIRRRTPFRWLGIHPDNDSAFINAHLWRYCQEEKIREGGRVHRKYDLAKTPYQRLMESDQISSEAKEELKAIYLSLNPAQLKRTIEAKLDQLYKLYQGNKRS